MNTLEIISVHVLQLPNDKNGRTAIVSASMVMPDGRIISDVCSVSPRSPFENEDTLEIAKNRVINTVKQKAKPYIQNHQNISQNATQDDKSKFKGGGDKPASRNQLALIRNKAQERGKNPEELAASALANAYKTSRDGRLIASSKNSLQRHASPTEGYPNTIGYPFSQLFAQYTILAAQPISRIFLERLHQPLLF